MTTTQNLKLGDQAPLFTLPDQNGKKIRLADFQGKKKVVLIFYPGDMTPGCTMQLCAVRDDFPKFLSCGAAVYGINHGNDASHKTFVKKHSFPFPLLVDAGKKISEKYGAIKTFFKAKIIKRSVVVINEEGEIIYLRRGMPKNAEILKALC